jgi:hypothetical protein
MGVGMMIISVVMRMAMVVGLILIGKFILELSADALIDRQGTDHRLSFVGGA